MMASKTMGINMTGTIVLIARPPILRQKQTPNGLRVYSQPARPPDLQIRLQAVKPNPSKRQGESNTGGCSQFPYKTYAWDDALEHDTSSTDTVGSKGRERLSSAVAKLSPFWREAGSMVIGF